MEKVFKNNTERVKEEVKKHNLIVCHECLNNDKPLYQCDRCGNAYCKKCDSLTTFHDFCDNDYIEMFLGKRKENEEEWILPCGKLLLEHEIEEISCRWCL